MLMYVPLLTWVTISVIGFPISIAAIIGFVTHLEWYSNTALVATLVCLAIGLSVVGLLVWCINCGYNVNGQYYSVWTAERKTIRIVYQA